MQPRAQGISTPLVQVQQRRGASSGSSVQRTFQAALRLRLALPVGKLMEGSIVPPASHTRMACKGRAGKGSDGGSGSERGEVWGEVWGEAVRLFQADTRPRILVLPQRAASALEGLVHRS